MLNDPLTLKTALILLSLLLLPANNVYGQGAVLTNVSKPAARPSPRPKAPAASAATASSASPSPSPVIPDPPKPLLLVSFERQAIRENDAIPVRVWFTNEWDQSLSSVTIHIDSPSKLKWNTTTCEKWTPKPNEELKSLQEFSLGAVGPHEVKPIDMCVRSESEVTVGDFNISFAADYSWDAKRRHSLVTTEKQLKANLFGSDAVAGVPIALAAFIVPGLFFLLMLDWWKFPRSLGGVGLGDKLIYSILWSLPLLYIVNRISPDSNPGISFRKLTIYALTGLAAGLVLGAGAWGWRWNRERQREERQVRLEFTPEQLLGKLLAIHPDYHKPVGIMRIGNDEYRGSLADMTDNNVVAVVGWFQIDRSKIDGPDKAEILAELDAAERSIDMYEVATKHGLSLDPFNAITMNGNEIEELGVARPKNDAYAVTQDGKGQYEPITLV